MRILLVPVIAGISYEFIQFAGKRESGMMNVLSKPGLWLQKLTTREPDSQMIEVAICSLEAVFDWKEFLDDGASKRKKNKQAKQKKETKQLKESEGKQKTEQKKEVAITKNSVESNLDLVQTAKENTSVKPATEQEQKKLTESVKESKNELDEEEDNILKALDRYFEQ